MTNKLLLIKSFILIIYFIISGHIQPARAVQFDFTEISTDEGHVYNNSPSSFGIRPTGLNNVTQFKVEWDNGGTTQTDTYKIGSGVGEFDFKGLDINVTNTSNVIQYVGAHQLNTGTDYLFSNPHEYVFAGDRGLSLSTGLNKVGTTDTEIITFPLSIIDINAVGDNVVDLFAADIAENQSYDSWDFIDENGNILAIADLQPYSFNETPLPNNDWHELGTQHLERIIISSNTLQTENSPRSRDRRFSNDPKKVYGVALEISDFKKADGSPLDATTAQQVRGMRISIPEASQQDSKTDYAFFGINQDSFDASTGVSNVPWEFSPTLGLILTGFGIVGHQWWIKSLDRTE